MTEFLEALYSSKRSKTIPEEYDFFGKLVGAWSILWTDNFGNDTPRAVKGEWIFAWVLNGTAIQDLFIVPSREERLQHTYPDAEFGTTLRIFNPQTLAWDIFYGCTGTCFRLTAYQVDDEIVLTENTEGKMRYVFSEIDSNEFQWRKECMDENGHYTAVAKVIAKRKETAEQE